MSAVEIPDDLKSRALFLPCYIISDGKWQLTKTNQPNDNTGFYLTLFSDKHGRWSLFERFDHAPHAARARGPPKRAYFQR